MENNFKSIDTKVVISQLYKSRDMMTIAMLRNTKLEDVQPLEDYCLALTKLVNTLARIYNNVEEISSSRYMEPKLHLEDMIRYMNSQRNTFKTKVEQKILDKMIALMTSTVSKLVYIDE